MKNPNEPLAENKSGTKLFLKGWVDGAYGWSCAIALVEHPEHGLLFMTQGFGGGDVEGMAHRWRHGGAHKVESVDWEGIRKMYSDESDFRRFVTYRRSGYIIGSIALERLAESLGI